MNKKLYLFLVLSLIFIYLLLLILKIDPEDLEISQISKENLNKNIIIQGKIIEIKDFKKTEFRTLTIQDLKNNSKIIKATIFSKNKLNLENKTCEITGKVIEYQKELQIETKTIKC